MVDPTLEHQKQGLSGRALTGGLIVKYGLLAIYGAWATSNEVPSFVAVGGSHFAIAWAAAVMVSALIALIGLIRTWRTGRFRLEKWTTAILILTFTVYGVVLIVRSVLTSDWGSAPLAILPFALVGFPTIRYYSLVIRGANRKDAKR